MITLMQFTIRKYDWKFTNPNASLQDNIVDGYLFTLNETFMKMNFRESFKDLLTDWVCTTGRI